MASGTRQRLILAARKRFYRDGFRNVGIDPILADVGISKAAFYKHFQSKDDLVVAVLQDLDGHLQQQFRRMIKDRGGPTAAGQLRAVMDVVQHEMEETDGFHGCIFVGAAMEFPLPHDPAHEAAARHKKWVEECLYELGERAGVADPAALAQEMCLVIEGAYVTRGITNDPKKIEIGRRLAEQIIQRHLPQKQAAPAPPAAPPPAPPPAPAASSTR